MNEPFAAVLLAGGRSRRMGRDKALLPLPDGRLLWERQLDVLLRELGPAKLFLSGPRRAGFPAGTLTCLSGRITRGPPVVRWAGSRRRCSAMAGAPAGGPGGGPTARCRLEFLRGSAGSGGRGTDTGSCRTASRRAVCTNRSPPFIPANVPAGLATERLERRRPVVASASSAPPGTIVATLRDSPTAELALFVELERPRRRLSMKQRREFEHCLVNTPGQRNARRPPNTGRVGARCCRRRRKNLDVSISQGK